MLKYQKVVLVKSLNRAKVALKCAEGIWIKSHTVPARLNRAKVALKLRSPSTNIDLKFCLNRAKVALK